MENVSFGLVVTVGAILVEAPMAVHFWRFRDDVRAARWFVATTVTSMLAAMSLVGQLLAGDLETAVIWSQLTGLAGLLALLSIFGFVVTYTHREWLFRTRWVGALVVASVAVFAVRLTNHLPGWPGLHEAWASGATTKVVAGFRLVEVGRGPLWIGYTLVVVLVLLVTVGFVVEFTLRPSQRLHRRRNAIVTVGVSVPVLASLAGQPIDAGFETTVPSVALSLLLFGAALSRFGVIDAAPIARSGVVDEIDGGVIVFDERETVLDVTERAREILGLADPDLGGPLADLLEGRLEKFRPEAALAEALDGETVTLAGDTDRYVETRVSTLTDRSGAKLSYALLLYDVTERETRKRDLLTERHARKALQAALADTSSIEAFATAACDQLDAFEAVRFAWVGTVSPGGSLTRLADTGAGDYFEQTSLTPDGGDSRDAPTAPTPASVAVGENTVYATAIDPAGADWERQAAQMGGTTAFAVPVEHDGVRRGVLEVHLADPTARVEERVTELATEVADILGYALGSEERRRALAADDQVELEIAIDGTADPLDTVVASTGAMASVTAAIPRDDDAVLRYVRLTAGDAEGFEHALGACDPVTDVVRLGNEDGTARFQFLAPEPTPRTLVAEHGGAVTEQRVGPDGMNITIRFPRGTNFEPVLTALEEHFGHAQVQGYADVGAAGGPEDPLASLTDRQREVLTAAYRSGYFEYPREQSATDVADQLGVSRPAFQEVLQAAQRNLLAETLEGQHQSRKYPDGDGDQGTE
jgi:PAS domain-containing protein